MPVSIPDKARELLDRPIVVAFATTNPDGQPQVTPVWVNAEGDQVWINSALGIRKDRNVRANPKVTVLVIDPDDDFNWAEIRGEVVEFDDSIAALEHVNMLSGIYEGIADYYAFNPRKKGQERRVIYKIKPTRVNGM